MVPNFDYHPLSIRLSETTDIPVVYIDEIAPLQGSGAPTSPRFVTFQFDLGRVTGIA